MANSNPNEYLGLSTRSKEGPRFATGQGRYTDDFTEPGMLQAVFIRSPHAHARILGVEAQDALNRQDVFAVVTPEDIKRDTRPFRPGRYAAGLKTPIEEYAGAVDKVRYVGEPLGAIAARDRSTAEDVLESITVDYEILPAITDVHQAVAGENPSLIYEELGANLAWQGNLEYGDTEKAFRESDRTVRENLKIHRYSSTPLEPLACIASFDRFSRKLTVRTNTQVPENIYDALPL